MLLVVAGPVLVAKVDASGTNAAGGGGRGGGGGNGSGSACLSQASETGTKPLYSMVGAGAAAAVVSAGTVAEPAVAGYAPRYTPGPAA